MQDFKIVSLMIYSWFRSLVTKWIVAAAVSITLIINLNYHRNLLIPTGFTCKADVNCWVQLCPDLKQGKWLRLIKESEADGKSQLLN